MMWKISLIITLTVIVLNTQRVTSRVHAENGFRPGRDALDIHPSSYGTAYVQFTFDQEKTVLVWIQTEECIGCKLLPIAYLSRETEKERTVALIDTSWATSIKVTTSTATYPSINNTYCELRHHFGLIGEYNLTVPATIHNTTAECSLMILKKPFYENTAVLLGYTVALVWIVGALIWYYCIKRHCFGKKSAQCNGNGHVPQDQTPLTPVNDIKESSTSLRLKSVDTFRGFALFNIAQGIAGDGHYWYISHSRYYGITVADFIFPWYTSQYILPSLYNINENINGEYNHVTFNALCFRFVFVMGTSIHLAFNNLLSKGRSYRSIFKKLVVRSITLFILGVCFQSHNDFRTLRIPGVLQRFGISYFVVASSYLVSRRLLARRKERTGKWYMMFRDVTDYLELPLAVCLITIHLLLTFLLPVPGCPLGYQGPGGPLVGENGELTNCTGGAAGYIDRMFFTEAHMITNSKSAKIYRSTVPVDPEGILGTFTCITLCIFGLQAGKILHLFSSAKGRIIRLLIWGMALITCSAVLSKCHLADGWIPINKTLWYVFRTERNKFFMHR
ncbi:heparan-alpha-glucosaminide N-acetyltransferase-like [Lytechinus variegatus]|uniref:heparan-alpha-glucosaminide N-acetyltransferase-like n=1 Tax=Lytechinus variegatus TaxID=7654 RepID=UPI001BB1C820|nr:heparan-alpha-glucosaminide N-acetyltransferase-like [Lytechinus variegatus]